MKKTWRAIVGILLCSTGLISCGVQFQQYDLADEYAPSLHYQPRDREAAKEEEGNSTLAGVPARSFYNGDLKRGAIWWANKGVTLEKADTFIFYVTHTGADSIPNGITNPAIDLPGTPFGATFPPLDFTKEEVAIRILAKAIGEGGESPVLYLQLADADGYQTNAKRPSHKIENSEGLMEYVFDLTDIFQQAVPKKHKVNGALINSLQFYINPGMAPFNGEIYIKEIKVIPVVKQP